MVAAKEGGWVVVAASAAGQVKVAMAEADVEPLQADTAEEREGVAMVAARVGT